jgi:hypothetical protein
MSKKNVVGNSKEILEIIGSRLKNDSENWKTKIIKIKNFP